MSPFSSLFKARYITLAAGIAAHIADNQRCWSDVVPGATHRLLHGPVRRLVTVMEHFALAGRMGGSAGTRTNAASLFGVDRGSIECMGDSIWRNGCSGRAGWRYRRSGSGAWG